MPTISTAAATCRRPSWWRCRPSASSWPPWSPRAPGVRRVVAAGDDTDQDEQRERARSRDGWRVDPSCSDLLGRSSGTVVLGRRRNPGVAYIRRMSDPQILPGAEPWSSPGGPHGALVLHGFTGSPQSMRGLAEAFAARGLRGRAAAAARPRHHGRRHDRPPPGTTGRPRRRPRTQALASRCERVVVAGLSMGGVAHAVAGDAPSGGRRHRVRQPDRRAGRRGPDRDVRRSSWRRGTRRIPGIGNDIADPDQIELAYDQTPLARRRSRCSTRSTELQPAFATITCPLLVMNSPQDHVVTPSEQRPPRGRRSAVRSSG